MVAEIMADLLTCCCCYATVAMQSTRRHGRASHAARIATVNASSFETLNASGLHDPATIPAHIEALEMNCLCS